MSKFNDNFIQAIKDNNIPLILKMIEKGAYINYKSDLALRIAVNSGYIELTHILIQHGARINIKNSYLIMIAVQNSFHEITKILLDNNINYIKKYHLMLNIAKNKNDIKMLSLLEGYFNYGQHYISHGEFFYKNNRRFKENLNRASYISKEKIKELLEGYDISDLIKSYIPIVNKSKGNLYAICPFHKENTPSFSIPSNRSFFYCFGCGASGNAIHFLMEYEKISFIKAARKISKIRGIKLK